ncbi:MAG: PadR family transcriptional regulator [Gemmatimonadetes bacterium]|nr:PadR family transcriptional regulator [Gemmatimonadota bacterium]
MDRRRRDTSSFLPLRPVEFHVLLSLAAGERHGYGIIQDAEARGDTSPLDVGTLYRALRRMREQGLIAEAAAPSSESSTDERRNYYRLTALGLEVGRAEARRLESLTRAARAGGLLKGVA